VFVAIIVVIAGTFQIGQTILPPVLNFFRKENKSGFVSISNVDSYYYSIDSLERTIPNVVQPDGSIPLDDQSQIDFFRNTWLRGRPIIKLKLSNAHQSEPIIIKGIYLNVNNQDYWWKLQTSLSPPYEGDISLAPNTNVVITGVPSNLPYTPTPNVVKAFAVFYPARPPRELWANIKVELQDGSTTQSNTLLKINKQNVKEYSPNADF
jgi:hypothetical protein